MVLPEDHVSEATAKVTAKSPPEEFAKGGVTTTPKKPLSLEEGKIEESSSLGVGCVIEGSSYLGVGGGHNLAANIELLTTQNVSMQISGLVFVYFTCFVILLTCLLFLAENCYVRTSLLLSAKPTTTIGLINSATRATAITYNKALDKMMQRRDKVNITLRVIERLNFDDSDNGDELMTMPPPHSPSKKSKNN